MSDRYVQELRDSGRHALGEGAYRLARKVLRAPFESQKKKGLPEGCPEEFEDVVLDFMATRAPLMIKQLDAGIDDEGFERYVGSLASYYFIKWYEKTMEGHLRDAMRQVLRRDKERFERQTRDGQCWKHREAPDRDTVYSEKYLAKAVVECPFDYKLADPYVEGSRVQYGKRGQMGNLLAVALKAAQGWTRLTILVKVVETKLPAELNFHPDRVSGSDVLERDENVPESQYGGLEDMELFADTKRRLAEASEKRNDPEWCKEALLSRTSWSGMADVDLSEYGMQFEENRTW